MIRSCERHSAVSRSPMQSDYDHGYVVCSYEESPYEDRRWATVKVFSKNPEQSAVFNALGLRGLAADIIQIAELMERKAKGKK